MARPTLSNSSAESKGRLDTAAALTDAMRLMIDGKTARAERILRKLLKTDPNNAGGLHLAGVARHRAGKLG